MEKQIETYLHSHIPISRAMGIAVEHASTQKVILCAPFANNINHKKTIFGGSLHAVATLACWTLLYVNLKELHPEHVQIVITKSEVDYQAPIDADFKSICLSPDEAVWQRFLKMLRAKGKSRIALSAKIHHNDRVCVDYRAEFAAIK